MFGKIVKILGLKPVQNLLSALTRKLLGQKGAVNKKVSATFNVAMLVAAGIALVKWLDPGLGEILAGYEGTLIAFVGLVGAIVAYFTEDD